VAAFEVVGNVAVQALGNVEVVVPPWMRSLSDVEVGYARRSQHASQLIVACGVDNRRLIMISGDGRVCWLHCPGHVEVTPTRCGWTVQVGEGEAWAADLLAISHVEVNRPGR
jgi:hypothetical protein